MAERQIGLIETGLTIFSPLAFVGLLLMALATAVGLVIYQGFVHGIASLND
ncbi:MAG: hypothetical protein QME78_10115 [Thermodesulfobacteriota bacterium]|nr:hypothetical protein [Thermodesulfobacteriota bacterium]